jgi:formamidopyrimidine-DNA glycosylase
MTKIIDDLVKSSEKLANWVLEKSSFVSEQNRELYKESLAPIIEELEEAIKAAKVQSSDPLMVKLFCRNEKCQAKGTYINRTMKMAEQSVYFCDVCTTPMSL